MDEDVGRARMRRSGERLEGPEFERRLAAMAQADLEAVGEARFPVYGVVRPEVSERWLRGWERGSGRVVKLVLEHGVSGGGAVRVETGVVDPGWRGLEEVVAEEPAAAGGGELRDFETSVVVDGEARVFRGVAAGEVWAARLWQEADAAPSLTAGQEPLQITVVGRGVPVGDVALGVVEDLAPFVEGRLRGVRERYARERGEAPAGEGVSALRELVNSCVRRGERERHRDRDRDRGSRGELWEVAVRQQMRLASESREEADAAVLALVNQMVRLGERTSWFPDSAVGLTALEESLRFTVFGSEVSSGAAQRAWGRVWDWSPGEASAGEAEAEWLAEWERWRASRA